LKKNPIFNTIFSKQSACNSSAEKAPAQHVAALLKKKKTCLTTSVFTLSLSFTANLVPIAYYKMHSYDTFGYTAAKIKEKTRKNSEVQTSFHNFAAPSI
jgi:hypothetical protein